MNVAPTTGLTFMGLTINLLLYMLSIDQRGRHIFMIFGFFRNWNNHPHRSFSIFAGKMQADTRHYACYKKYKVHI
jgi:hypothetical protein